MNSFYLRAAFNGLRGNKEREKYGKCHVMLKSDVDVAMDKAQKKINKTRTKADRNMQKRNMDVITIGFGRLLF